MSGSSGQRTITKLFSDNQSEENANLCAKIIQTWINHKDSQDSLLSALAGDYTIDRLLTTLDDENIINSIKNKDGSDLPTSIKKRMMAVRSFINTLQNEFGPISIGQPDYLKATKVQFDRFVMMHSTDKPVDYDGELAMKMYSSRKRMEGATTATAHSGDSDADVSDPTETAMQEVDKKLKWETNSFPELRDVSQWVNFELRARCLCAIHKMQDTLDENYSTEDDTEKELFRRRNTLLYLALTKSLKDNPKGRELLGTYANDFDGRAVYLALRTHYTGAGGVLAKATEQALLSFISGQIPHDYRNYRLGDLLSEWRTKTRLYEEARGGELSWEEKLRKLEHYIAPVKELSQVANMGGMVSTMSGKTTSDKDTAERTIYLYEAQALKYDQENKNRILKQRAALHTELTVCMLAQQQDAAFDDDIRVVQLAALDFAKYDDDDYVEAYMGEMRRSPRSSLKEAAWKALTPSEQALWDKFSPEAKEMILSSRSLPKTIRPRRGRHRTSDGTRSSDPSTQTSGSTPVSHQARVNVTDTISSMSDTSVNDEFLANMAELLHSDRHAYMVRFEHEIRYHALMVRREDDEVDDINSDDNSADNISMRDFTQHIASPVAVPTLITGNQLRTPSDILRQVLHDSSRDSPAHGTEGSTVADDGEIGSFYAAIGSATIDAARASGSSTTNAPNKRLRTINDLLAMNSREEMRAHVQKLNQEERDNLVRDSVMGFKNVLRKINEKPSSGSGDIALQKGAWQPGTTPLHTITGTSPPVDNRRVVGHLGFYSNTLVDRGANGGIGGEGLRLIAYSFPLRHSRLHVAGGTTHPRVKIGNFGGVTETRLGTRIICIFHDYAHLAGSRTIHSSLQVEHGGNIVDDRHPAHGGNLHITTRNGITIPLAFSSGLAHLRLRPFTDEEWNTLPRIPITLPIPWNPNVYDRDPTIDYGSREANMVHSEEDSGSNHDTEDGEIGNTAEEGNDGVEDAVGTEDDGEIEAFKIESIWDDASEGIVNIAAMNERFYGEDADFLEEGYELTLPAHVRELYNIADNRSIIVPKGDLGIGIVGDNVHLVNRNDPPEYVDIVSSNGQLILEAEIGVYAAVTTDTSGKEVLVIFHDYAYLPNCLTTLHSAEQIRATGHIVKDYITRIGDFRTITADGHFFHLTDHQGMSRMNLRAADDEDFMDEMPRINLTTPYLPTRGEKQRKVTVRGPIEEMIRELRQRSLGVPMSREEARLQDDRHEDHAWHTAERQAIMNALKRDDCNYITYRDAHDAIFTYDHIPTRHNNPQAKPQYKCRVTTDYLAPSLPFADILPQNFINYTIGSIVQITHAPVKSKHILIDNIIDTRAPIGVWDGRFHANDTLITYYPVDIQRMQGQDEHWHTQAIIEITGGIEEISYDDLQCDLHDILDESRAQGWHKLLFDDVAAEIDDLSHRAPVEASLYSEHMGIDIDKIQNVFWACHGNLILEARIYERYIHEEHLRTFNGPKSSTRTKLNARIRLLKSIYDMIKDGVRIIRKPITISVQYRKITRPHILLFSPHILQVMRSYGFGYNILIEGLMYGNARRARALMSSSSDNDFSSSNTLDVHPINPNLNPGYRTYVDYAIDDISVVRYGLNGEPIDNDGSINND